jgi:hypothetical protein
MSGLFIEIDYFLSWIELSHHEQDGALQPDCFFAETW